MNTEALFLFLILLLGLVLCSFLGGNCGQEGMTTNTKDKVEETKSYSGASTRSKTQYDNYNHYTGSSTELTNGAIFYGKNGTTAEVIANSDGSQSLQILLPGSSTPVLFNQSVDKTTESYINYYGPHGNATIYYGPNGATATVVNANNGQQAIKVETSSGIYYYNVSGVNDTSTQYFGSTGTQIQPIQNNVNAGSVTGPEGNTAYYARGPAGNTVIRPETNVNPVTDDYYNTLPPGIPRSQIPAGQEDLYILKSQIVPPVCPACPVMTTAPKEEKCPPCPACARCPEPAFECKKVPNYSAINNDYLPTPILNDFSTFGM